MLKILLTGCALALCTAGSALAHFGMAIPSASTLEEQKDAALSVEFSFSHPMEGVGMPLEKPARVRVFADGKAEDVSGALQPATIMGHEAWKLPYTVRGPGVHHFVMEPRPYWEPAEDCFIIHHTKTVVAAFGEEEGWEEPLGLKTEIVPLTRPFGNYAGNVFQGRVLIDGKSAPGAMVEVEFYNRDKKYEAPGAYHITQTVRADRDGVFSFGIPFAGWWGFAALHTAEEKMDHQGEEKEVELGAVLWAEFVDPVRR